MVTRCCGCPMPNAQISVDGHFFGSTGAAAVSCGLRLGEHSLLAEHQLLSPGLTMPLMNISGSTTCGVQVAFPLDRLHFVCTAAPGTVQCGAAELWLVAGDLAQWRCSRGAPPMDAEVWLWDGVLSGQRRLEIQAGVLSRHSWGIPGEDEVQESSEGFCLFSEGLCAPCSSFGPWAVALHAARSNGCAVTRLAAMATEAAPSRTEDDCASSAALWLGRLVPESDAEEEKRLVVHSACCSSGAAGVAVTLNGDEAGSTGEDGQLILQARGSCVVGIQGIPPCLLPGSTSEFTAHLDTCSRVDLELSCLVWVYWWRPDEDDEEADVQDAFVFLCTNVEQIPDEAMPIEGSLFCAEAEESPRSASPTGG
ncbi:unnamed protein product [Effrenium voratum]|nr:unnamed protein product [Effrenium voratum]